MWKTPGFRYQTSFRLSSERSAAEMLAILTRELRRASAYWVDGQWNEEILRGHVQPANVMIYILVGRSFFQPAFQGEVVSLPDGGAELTGTVGPVLREGGGVGRGCLLGGVGIFALVGLIEAIVKAAHGQFVMALPFLGLLAGCLAYDAGLRWLWNFEQRRCAARGAYLEDWLRRKLAS